MLESNLPPIYSPNGIKTILHAHGLAPGKDRGQNYLCDRNLAAKMVGLIGSEPRRVLEIGPGLGSLTHLLIETGHSVSAIEIDRGTVAFLRPVFPTLLLTHGDALDESWTEADILISSVPYAIAGPLLAKIVNYPCDHVIVLLQKELAERLVAPIPGRGVSRIGVQWQLRFESRAVLKIPPQSFYPKPHVDNLVIQGHSRLGFTMSEIGHRLLAQLFQARRKTIGNSLKAHPDLLAHVNQQGIQESRRAEELTLDEWRGLLG